MGAPLDWTSVDVVVPAPSVRLPGVTMAGFRQRVSAPVDIAMVAHPAVTVIIDLGESKGIVYDACGRRERGSVVIGLLPGEVRAGGVGAECLQIRLEPAVAVAVFGTPELVGTVAGRDAVWGRDAVRMEARLRAAASWDERFAVVAGLLGRRLGDRGVDPAVLHSWRRTVASGGRVRVEGLAEEVGWSRKRLWSRFRAQVGISPKRAGRLVRFDRAARLLAAGQDAASVAAESGYVDQAHLNREVKAFTGLTPRGLAVAPWLAIDDVAWPGSSPARWRAAGRLAGAGAVRDPRR